MNAYKVMGWTSLATVSFVLALIVTFVISSNYENADHQWPVALAVLAGSWALFALLFLGFAKLASKCKDRC